MQAKEKSKYFMCQSQNEEKKSFNFKVSFCNLAFLSIPRALIYYVHSISLGNKKENVFHYCHQIITYSVANMSVILIFMK